MAKSLAPHRATRTPTTTSNSRNGSGGGRINLSLAQRQNALVDEISVETGLSRQEVVRHAIALFNVAIRARKKGLDVAMINDDDDVVGHIATTY